MAMSLEGLALIAAAGESLTRPYAERTARLFGAAEALREAAGAPMPPVDRADFERASDAARAALGEDEYKAAKDAGRVVTLDQVMAYAFEENSA